MDNKEVKQQQVSGKKDTAKIFGSVGSILSILMYVSYIPQIIANLNGEKGTPLQPLVAFINCTIWLLYGLLKKEKDWPIIIANIPGILFGIVTFITAIV